SAQGAKVDARRIPKPAGQLDGRVGLRLRPASVAGVALEFVRDLGQGKRLLSTAAHMRLALFDAAAVVAADVQVAGERAWIGIGRVGPVAGFWGGGPAAAGLASVLG